MQRDPYQEEQSKLTHTLQAVENQLHKLHAIPRYYGDDLVEQALDEIRLRQRTHLEIAKDQPFFGRLDFQAHGSPAVERLYIGKAGVKDDQTQDVLVTDWRAPISSLFYSFNGATDEVSYESPDGLVEGTVYLKRNIAIRNRALERVVDSYVRGRDNLGVTDEYLLYRLEEKKDNRLRDIVSTIQAEQDHIIRAERNKALVIQGVAGSGKTTVALHRIAYMLYQYQDRVRPEKIIIFAPNRMFLDYISDVLPELGVGGIQQTTFLDWASQSLSHDICLQDSTDRIANWFDPRTPDNPEWIQAIRYKGSIRFLEDIRTSLTAYEQSCVPPGDFEAWEGQVLSEETVRQWFFTEYSHYPILPRRDRVFARIQRWLDMALKQGGHLEAPRETKRKASQRLKNYIKKWPAHTPLTFYAKILAEKSLKADNAHGKMQPVQLRHEDLAPLVYIHDRMFGISQDNLFDHVVIDEAQDFSPFQVAVLREHCPSQSFTILGDLSQNIYSFQGIQSWSQFMNLFPETARGFYELKRSYRSTVEIIEFANEVLKGSNEELTLAEPVFRSGAKVQVWNGSMERRLTLILDALNKLKLSDVSTAAVVTRTEPGASELHAALMANGIEANLVSSSQRDYQGGISVIPVHLTKGLEFDVVLLVDVDQVHYPKSARNAKLLYVGCTRALHALWLITTESPSALIRDIPPTFYETCNPSTPSL